MASRPGRATVEVTRPRRNHPVRCTYRRSIGYDKEMRLKRAAIVGSAGFAAGYYLGARAGRKRYDQLRRVIGPLGTAFSKGSAVVQLAGERFRRDESDEPGVRDAVYDSSR
jgi:hypothetical protein